MTRPRLSHEARKLLETDLDSIEKLEAICYLQEAEDAVSRDELMHVLRLDRAATATLVGELVRAGLADASDDRGGLRPGARVESEACQELLESYAEDRLTVVSVLSTIAMDRIRSMAMRAFGEALVGRRKPSDGGG